MIKLFKATDKLYSTNGDLVLNPTKASVHKEDNGAFYLDLETLLSEREINERETEQGTIVEGTSLSITDVDVVKKFTYSAKGQTTQTGTPTPTNPVPINITTGRQEVVVCGNNLLNTNTFVKGRIDPANGQIQYPDGITDFSTTNNTITFTSNATWRGVASDFIPITTGNYYFKMSVSTTSSRLYAYVDYYDNEYNYISRLGNNGYVNGDTKTWTLNLTEQNARYIRIHFQMQQIGTTTITNPMLSDSDTTYEEYKGNTYEINLGKNLFSGYTFSKTTNGITYTYNNDGTILVDGTSTGNAYSMLSSDATNFYRTLEAGTYTISGGITGVNVQLMDSSGTALANTTSKQTFTITEPKRYYLRLYISSGKTFDNQTIYIQLEKGSGTSYSPYKTPIELCKIGNYQDKIYKQNGNWYIHKEIGRVVLNGSESWNVNGNTTDYGQYLVNIANKEYGILNIISNKFITKNTNIENCIAGRNTNSNIYITIAKSIVSYNINNFKTWLGNNNVTVYYVLATPTNTLIEDEELINQLESIKLLSGLNNVSISSPNLPFIMQLKYNYVDDESQTIKYIDYLVPNNIVVANTPQGDQAFRITNVEKTRRKIKIKANHVFYDSANYLIADSYVVDKNCNDALDHLNNATDNTSPFTTISNVNHIDSYRCVRKSLYEAVQVVIERWGGHLTRDNWTFGIYDSIGQDNGVTIRYAKNLKDITASYEWNDVVTKLLPVGKDGILLNAVDTQASIYVESAQQYEIPYTKTISFDQSQIEEDDYKDEDGVLDEDTYKQALVDDLYTQAMQYVTNNYLPKVNYKLSANVEKVSDVGDSVEVIDEKLGINLMTNIISYDYDCILKRYTQLEFGNFIPTLADLMTQISVNTEELINAKNETLQITLNEELEAATDKIWNALGNSYVIYEGDKILVVDSLPKETATNVIMINNGGIAFSNSGITGTFSSAWTIDNVLNMENINVINLTADLIKGGTLKLGSNLNQNGKIEVFDEANTLIAELNKNGLKMYGADGSYVLMNNQVGFAGFDRNDNKIYWVDKDVFHQKKSEVEEEITLVKKMRIIPITIRDNNNQIVNDGIGFVNVGGGV